MRGSRRSITFFSVFFLERMEFFFKEKKGAHSSETRKFLYSRPAGMAVSIDWHGIGFGCGERVFQRVWRVVRVVGRGWAGVCVCCSCHDRWPVGWRGVLIFFVCVFIIYHHHLARLFTFAGWGWYRVFFLFLFFYQRVVRDQISVSGFFFLFFSFGRKKERAKEREKERRTNSSSGGSAARCGHCLRNVPPTPNPHPVPPWPFLFFFLFFCLFRCVCVCVPFICQSVLFFPAEVARITFSVGNLHKIICESNGK